MEKSDEKTEKSGIQGKLREIFGTMVKTFQLPRQLSSKFDRYAANNQQICSKFTGEHPCRSVISIKLLCNFIEITLS